MKNQTAYKWSKVTGNLYVLTNFIKLFLPTSRRMTARKIINHNQIMYLPRQIYRRVTFP